MKKTNLYWPIFRNLEKEVLALAETIHFCDEQLDVYSIKIAELLIRCVVEIESISKELYEQNSDDISTNDNTDNQRRNLYFDTDCLKFLERKWVLSKKQVLISSPMLYFEKEENRLLTPLKKADRNSDSSADWKRAYQAVKHDRGKCLDRANIKHLIRAMAALYLLNIYYRDENFSTNSAHMVQTDFDTSLGSNLFSIKLSSQVHINQINRKDSMGTDAMIVDGVYLLCFPVRTIQKIRDLEKETLQKQKHAITSSIECIDFHRTGEDISDCQNLFSVVQKIGHWAYKKGITSLPTKDKQLNAIYDSSEYKWFHEHNSHILEKIAKDDVDALCASVGHWGYSQRVLLSYEKVLSNVFFNSRLDIVLNKGQCVYANVGVEDT
jgi:hypothetical protein